MHDVNHKGLNFAALRGQVRRLIRFRLLLPMLRGRRPVDYTARGVFYGLLVGLTPTVGIQSTVIVGIWCLLRWLDPKWEFSLIPALAWTWVTNAVTIAPIYYLFLLTGQVMLGRFEDLAGYGAFAEELGLALQANTNWLENLWAYMANLLDHFGVPMFFGSIPWAVIGSWIGYRWSYRALVRFREIMRGRRMSRRRRRGLRKSRSRPA